MVGGPVRRVTRTLNQPTPAVDTLLHRSEEGASCPGPGGGNRSLGSFAGSLASSGSCGTPVVGPAAYVAPASSGACGCVRGADMTTGPAIFALRFYIPRLARRSPCRPLRATTWLAPGLLALPQHADEHRPERPLLLYVSRDGSRRRRTAARGRTGPGQESVFLFAASAGDSRSRARRNAIWPCARTSSRRSRRHRRCACG